MSALVCKEPTLFRLRRVDDDLETPGELFQDEESTLHQEGVESGHLLWLEEGKPPIKGGITVRFQLYRMLDCFEFASPAWHLSPFYRFKSGDEISIEPLCTLDISMYWKVADVKQMLLDTQPGLKEMVVRNSARGQRVMVFLRRILKV